MSWWRDWIITIRAVDRLLSLEEKHSAAIKVLQAELEQLRNRITVLESREGILLVEAKGAAASAASAVAVNSIGDLSRRVGVLEGRLEHGSMSGQDQVSKAKPGTTKRGPKLPKS